MAGRLRQLALALALAACGPMAAQAQLNPFKGQTAMSQEDLAAMRAAAAKLFTDRASTPGSVEQWAGSGGASGTVRLVRWYEFEGMPCARLLHELQPADSRDPQTFTIDRCQTSDGDWKIR